MENRAGVEGRGCTGTGDTDLVFLVLRTSVVRKAFLKTGSDRVGEGVGGQDFESNFRNAGVSLPLVCTYTAGDAAIAQVLLLQVTGKESVSKI